MNVTPAAGAARLLVRRWLKFNTVGAMGIVVQLAALAIFKSLAGLHYLVATGLAVEIAVLHNFGWHERWTWLERTRRGNSFKLVLGRLFRFNFTTGMTSLISNLVLMRLLVGRFHLHYLLANVVTIAVCSLANFLVSEFFVFRKSGE